jgi:hypothetical protein
MSASIASISFSNAAVSSAETELATESTVGAALGGLDFGGGGAGSGRGDRVFVGAGRGSSDHGGGALADGGAASSDHGGRSSGSLLVSATTTGAGRRTGTPLGERNCGTRFGGMYRESGRGGITGGGVSVSERFGSSGSAKTESVPPARAIIPSATNGTQRGIRPMASCDPSKRTNAATAMQPAPKKKSGKLAARLLISTSAELERRLRWPSSGRSSRRTDGMGRP